MKHPHDDPALERFLDGDLPPDHAADIARRLRQDADLRARVESLRALDERIGRALADPARRPARRLARRRLAAAALLLLCAYAAPLYLARSNAPSPAAASPDATYGLLIATRALPRAETPPTEPLARTDSPAQQDLLARLDDALAQRRPADAVALILDAGEAPELWAALGERIRLGSTAEEALDALPPRTQLAVCEVWAHRKTLRPIAFNRLRALAREPDLAPDAALVFDRLSANPDLAPWLSSYAQR